eukprot:SAG11_NODE_816_length_7030_cov_15.673784_2_plen_68_part_00
MAASRTHARTNVNLNIDGAEERPNKRHHGECDESQDLFSLGQQRHDEDDHVRQSDMKSPIKVTDQEH